LTIYSSLISLELKTFEDSDDENNNKSDKIIVRLAHFSVKEYLVLERIL